ncbi:MAG: hypothetical protein AAGG68_10145 [Bacteroidota bacterium]
MKIILSTVGTSIFDNYLSAKTLFDKRGRRLQTGRRHNDKQAVDKINRIKKEAKSSSSISEYRIKDIVEVLNKNWLKSVTKDDDNEWDFKEGLNEFASAEIESILKILSSEEDVINVHLIATDTVLSQLAAEIISSFLNTHFSDRLKAHFNAKQDVIQDLRIDNYDKFKLGLVRLSDRFYQIVGNKLVANLSQEVILNITGGYKAIIPFLSLLGQVNQTKIQYTFEDTGVLIEIPQLPIKQNDKLFERYWKELHRLENEILNQYEYPELLKDLSICFDLDGNDFCFNFLGNALWKRFINRYFLSSCTDEVWKEIEHHGNIQKEITTNFYSKEHRVKYSVKKPEPYNDHLCYGKGRHDPRIFYLEDGEEIIIYKTFPKHNQNYETYLKKLADVRLKDLKEHLIQNTALRKIELKGRPC